MPNIINARKLICFRNQLGFNAIELSLVLAVIAIAIVATIRIMGGNTDKQNSNQLVNDVSTLVTNIRNAYSSGSLGYGSLTQEAAIAMKIIPADLRVVGSDAIRNQFQGSNVNIVGDSSGDFFTITYTKVPAAVCVSAITTLGSSQFIAITVGGATVYDDNTAFDAGNIARSCSGDDGTNKTADITFRAG